MLWNQAHRSPLWTEGTDGHQWAKETKTAPLENWGQTEAPGADSEGQPFLAREFACQNLPWRHCKSLRCDCRENGATRGSAPHAGYKSNTAWPARLAGCCWIFRAHSAVAEAGLVKDMEPTRRYLFFNITCYPSHPLSGFGCTVHVLIRQGSALRLGDYTL